MSDTHSYYDICNSFSYSFTWKMSAVHELKDDNTKYNLLRVNYPDNHRIKYVELHSTKDKLSLNMHSKICTSVSWGYLHITYYIIYNEDKIFKAIPCELKLNEDGYWHGNVSYGNSEDFSKHTDLLLGPRDFIDIVCKITRVVDERSRSQISSIMKMENRISNDQIEVFEDLLDDAKFYDVKLLAADGQVMHAHKAILAARSPVFSTMFQNEMKEKTENIVEISDIDFSVLESFVRYIYTRKFDDELALMSRDLLPVAEKYDVKDLKGKCEEAIIRQLTVENAVETLIYADKYNADNLKMKTKDFIAYRSKAVIETQDFKDLGKTNVDLLTELFCTLSTKIENVKY